MNKFTATRQGERASTYMEVVAQARLWRPPFKIVDTAEEAADLINFAHEDYPRRIPKTIEMLEYFTSDEIAEEIRKNGFSERDMMMIHSHIMDDLPSRGKYRDINVTVGNHNPPEHYLVKDLMRHLFPPMANEREDMEWWYRRFQTIHGFSDGNGRTGGVLVACMHKIHKGTFLAPNKI